MGMFRIEIQAVGNHGCQREKKDGEKVERCHSPSCVDCITREYLDKLKASSAAFFDTNPNLSEASRGYAKLTHWPGQLDEVRDDLLTGVRSGNF